MVTLDDIKKHFSIVVPSHDGYSDLWDVFFKVFFKYWPDCPFNIYLLTGDLEFNFSERVKNVKVGNSSVWSEALMNALKIINEDYVFLILEDLFLINFVDTNSVLEVFKWILTSHDEINYVRLVPSPRPDYGYNELVGVVSKGSIYRTSTVFSVWKKDVLLDLLLPNENAWEFEIKGSERSDKYDGFYCTWKSYFKFVNGVVKGKWSRKAIKKLKSLGVDVDLRKREVMSKSEELKYYFKEKRSKLFKVFVPSKYRRKIRSIFKKGSLKW